MALSNTYVCLVLSFEKSYGNWKKSSLCIKSCLMIISPPTGVCVEEIQAQAWWLRLTSEDGLVNTEGGGLDANDPDVSGDFVTN